jgi:hypothetical protein
MLSDGVIDLIQMMLLTTNTKATTIIKPSPVSVSEQENYTIM